MAIVTCTRCVRSQIPYRISSLSSKYGECVRKDKKCEPAVPVVNFSTIDKAIEKLKRKELEAEAALNTTNAQIKIATELARTKRSKLKRLRNQRKFLKEKE